MIPKKVLRVVVFWVTGALRRFGGPFPVGMAKVGRVVKKSAPSPAQSAHVPVDPPQNLLALCKQSGLSAAMAMRAGLSAGRDRLTGRPAPPL